MELIHESLWLAGVAFIALLLLLLALRAINLTQEIREDAARARHHRARYDGELERMRRAAEQSREKAGWTSWRKFEVVAKTLEDDAGTMCRCEFRPHDGGRLPEYEPGQFLTLRLSPAGQSRPIVRCYSLSAAPGSDVYQVSVKRIAPAAPDMPPGVASTFIHDRLQIGDLIDLKAPSGQFCLDADSVRPVVLLGAGSGITPLLSMAAWLCREAPEREVWLFYGVRRAEEVIRLDDLATWSRESGLNVHLCVSDGSAGEYVGAVWHRSTVNVDLLRECLPSNNYEFFVCGPAPMIAEVNFGLVAWGVPEDDIHEEKYGPGAIGKRKQASDPHAEGPEVVFRRSGKTVRWDSSMAHLWELAFSSDVDIESGCLEGDCGTCQTGLISGKVKYLKTPGFDVARGSILPCCCVPQGRVEIDA